MVVNRPSLFYLQVFLLKFPIAFPDDAHAGDTHVYVDGAELYVKTQEHTYPC